MIDLHCHILPGIDDGADQMSDSIEMVKKAIEQEITCILCTPHHRNGRYENKKETVLQAVSDLQNEIDKQQLDFKILAGQEVRIHGDLLDEIEKDTLLFVDEAATYLMIELPTLDVPIYTETLLFELRTMGKVPIIVHPERNAKFRENPDLLLPYLDMGCLAQVTAPSLVGMFGKSIQKISKEMVKRNLVQMVASDAHGVNKRTFYLKEAYTLIEKEYGIEKRQLMEQVAQDISRGFVVNYPKYQPKKKKFIWF